MSRKQTLLVGLLLLLAAARFAFNDVLWVEEAYPTAAAREILAGKLLYRDIWFDKPPVFPLTYLLWGAQTGWPLRLAGALFVLLSCWIVARAARLIWGQREAAAAALLLAFYLTFWIPSAVLSLTPDLLLLPLHVAAVALAIAGFPFWSGAVAGVGMLINTKAAFVLLACAIWQWRALPRLLAGFALPAVLPLLSADYRQQVVEWGAQYSRDLPDWVTWREGPVRTLNWMGFHSTIVVGAIWFWWKERDRRSIAWAVIAFLAVCLGWRFFPRYYFHLLPVIVLCGARGLVLMGPRCRLCVLPLLLIPLIRFGPRYLDHSNWSDLALFEDSRRAADYIRAHAKPGDTILVWGYRPDIQVLSGLHSGTRFLDSQPLTGVIADRHLIESRPSFVELSDNNRAALIETSPVWLVDGLVNSNPLLQPDVFPDLIPWFDRYRYVMATPLTRIYRLEEPVPTAPK
jgi:hypothetical protein